MFRRYIGLLSCCILAGCTSFGMQQNTMQKVLEALRNSLVHQSLTQSLTQQNVDINERLYLAGGVGDLKLVRELVEKGAQVNAKSENHNGQSVLYIASFLGHYEVVKYLIEQGGADINSTDFTGVPVLNIALEGGCFEVFKYLFEAGAHFKTSDPSETLLHFAVRSSGTDRLRIVKYLVETCKCDVNAKRAHHVTVLQDAADGSGSLEVVDYLVKKGAILDLDFRLPKEGATAKYLFDLRSLNKLFLKDVEKLMDTSILEYTLKCGGQINTRDENGKTALHLAAGKRNLLTEEKKNLEIVKYLVSKKINIEAKDRDGRTALHACCLNSTVDAEDCKVVEYLINIGLRIDEKDYYGMTPLHYLMIWLDTDNYDNLAVVKKLLQGLVGSVDDSRWNRAQRLLTLLNTKAMVKPEIKVKAGVKRYLELKHSEERAGWKGKTVIDIAKERHRNILVQYLQVMATEAKKVANPLFQNLQKEKKIDTAFVWE